MILYHLIFLIFFFTFGIQSGKIRPNFDEIFGNEWDKNGNDENEAESIEQMQNNQQKREIIKKFDSIREKMREKGKHKRNDHGKIERKIAKLLGTKRELIQKWKNELNLNKIKIKKRFYEQKKCRFIERFNEFKELYGQGKQKEFVKELGISEETFRKWKRELAPNYYKKRHTNEEKLKKMKKYFEIKEGNPKMSDEIIAKKLAIGLATLQRWKKEFTTIN